MSAILARHPGVRGVLFDQSHVVAGAAPVLQAAGVADRCRVVGGSFFEAVPDGGDAYLLRAIVHDWEDEQAKAVLQSCRRAMGAGATLLVIERELLVPNEGPEGKFADLNMLVAAGGRERTREEYAALYSSAGFRLARSIPAGNEVSIIEGVPA